MGIIFPEKPVQPVQTSIFFNNHAEFSLNWFTSCHQFAPVQWLNQLLEKIAFNPLWLLNLIDFDQTSSQTSSVILSTNWIKTKILKWCKYKKKESKIRTPCS